MEKKSKKKEIKLERKSYKLIDIFKQQRKTYEVGDSIQATLKGAEYLRLIKKIK
jgi:hypothetical protein